MIFIDRLTGDTLTELPEKILPGRYQLTEPLLYNGHSSLHAGDYLLDDGSSTLQIMEANYELLQECLPNDIKAKAALAAEAIVAIEGKILHSHLGVPSPLLPFEMAAQCKLEPMEDLLQKTLDSGHLQTISAKPRMDLRYEEMTVPVGRARRLASNALSHLASHSDCWQQRTLSGVQPRKILARLSEDDYGIYENRLYKRLLDRLDTHLANRLSRIHAINRQFEDALKFHKSDKTHHLLRNRICVLWGESYTSENTGDQLEAGREAEKALKDQLKSIRALKQHGLYKHLPAASTVPTQIHRTNILNHDSHYRHIPPLWSGLHSENDTHQLHPNERLQHQQAFQFAYFRYVGLVLKRSLEKYSVDSTRESYEWAGKTLQLKSEENIWSITYSDAAPLQFVPIAWQGEIPSIKCSNKNRIICWLGQLNTDLLTSQLFVSPMNLYVIEQMGFLIDKWLLHKIASQYAEPLGPLPGAITALTKDWPEFEDAPKSKVKLVSPLDAEKKSKLRVELAKGTNEPLKFALEASISNIETLTKCRYCNKPAKFSYTKPDKFYCKCKDCENSWEIKNSEGTRVFIMKPGQLLDSDRSAFEWAGRDWIEFNLD